MKHKKKQIRCREGSSHTSISAWKAFRLFRRTCRQGIENRCPVFLLSFLGSYIGRQNDSLNFIIWSIIPMDVWNRIFVSSASMWGEKDYETIGRNSL